jgi:hypothetical protein
LHNTALVSCSPQLWRLRFIVQSRLAPGRTMTDHSANLKDHHAYLQGLHKRGVLHFMGPWRELAAVA